jgi:transposase
MRQWKSNKPVLKEGFMRRTKEGNRRFGREFKIDAVRRVEQGEAPAKVARDLRIDHSLLSKWCRQVRLGGEGALKELGRPVGSKTRPSLARGSDENRVAQLERLVGRQQEMIDFLEQALRRVEESRQSKSDSGATASSK